MYKTGSYRVETACFCYRKIIVLLERIWHELVREHDFFIVKHFGQKPGADCGVNQIADNCDGNVCHIDLSAQDCAHAFGKVVNRNKACSQVHVLYTHVSSGNSDDHHDDVQRADGGGRFLYGFCLGRHQR